MIIIPWKVASMRLPSPLLVHDILPAVFVTSNLREDEGTLEPRVQRTGHVVVDPSSCGPTALLGSRALPSKFEAVFQTLKEALLALKNKMIYAYIAMR